MAGKIQKEINWDVVELYIKSGCSQIKIAKSFFIDVDTLRARVKKKYGVDYSVLSAALCSEGELLIAAQQFQKAMKGYWPALLWLGKVLLKQKEPEGDAKETPSNDEIISLQHALVLKDERIRKLEKLIESSQKESIQS